MPKLMLLLLIAIASCSTAREAPGQLQIPMMRADGTRAAVIFVGAGRSALARPGVDSLVWLEATSTQDDHIYTLPLTATLIVTMDQARCRQGRSWVFEAFDGRPLEANCRLLSTVDRPLPAALMARGGEGARVVEWRSDDGSVSDYASVFNRRGDFLGIWFNGSDPSQGGDTWLVEGGAVPVTVIARVVRGAG
jgi:hypothetical protein